MESQSRTRLKRLSTYVWQHCTHTSPGNKLLEFNSFKNFIVLSVYSSNFHAVKRESDGAPGDLTSLENERQIYKSVLEGGDIPLQGLSGLKRPSSSASTKGNGV